MPMLHAGKDTVSNLEGIVPGPSAADTGVPRFGTEGHQLPQRSLRRGQDAGALGAGTTQDSPRSSDALRPADRSAGGTTALQRKGRRDGRRLRDRTPTLAETATALGETGQLSQTLDEGHHCGARINVRTTASHHHHPHRTMHHTAERTLHRSESDGGVFSQTTVDRHSDPGVQPVTSGLGFSRGAVAPNAGWQAELVAGDEPAIGTMPLKGRSGGKMMFTEFVDDAALRHTIKLSSTSHE